MTHPPLATTDRLESRVRSYCRSFPTVFVRARGAMLEDTRGRRYIDFFAGAGALNYGHNEPHLKRRLVEYLASDGIAHGLDMATLAKEAWMRAFDEIVLAPRRMSYRLMFPGPTGTNAVEAALKLARKVTGRSTVVAFTNAFHGMTLGALALTGSAAKRAGAGVPHAHVAHLPYDGYLGPGVDTVALLRRYLEDPSSGLGPPAAIVLETVQAEGGVNVASAAWVRRLAALAREVKALLVVDDIQVGCGRTGPFFSFEGWGVQPDVVCLSKSLSGFGLPLSMLLIRPDLDRFAPGEHNGTFRGNNHAFVTGAAALEHYWTDDRLTRAVADKARTVKDALERLAERHGGSVRGRGLVQGVRFEDPTAAARVAQAAFERGVVIETAGARGEVLKILPPLTIDPALLKRGLTRLEAAADQALEGAAPAALAGKEAAS